MMADPKRIQLDAPNTLHREKKQKALPPTRRFELNLNTDSTTHNIRSRDYAEFSYAALVKETKFSDNELDDQKLREIAGSYEGKYNPKLRRKKKKKLAVSEDYIDKGIGYDETDPFIDNEEAYDELVPSTLTTQFGVFYINKGELEFRHLGDDGGYDDRFKKRSNGDKHKLGEENQKPYGRKPLHSNDNTNTLVNSIKKWLPTVADMLQEQKMKFQLVLEKELQKMKPIPISVERELEPIQTKAEENYMEEVLVEEMTAVNSGQVQGGSTITETIESVIKAAVEDLSNESAELIAGSNDGEGIKIPSENVVVPNLPDNLPPELCDIVTKFKKLAFEEIKCKFFSDDVNYLLLSIELKAQTLTSDQRSRIYAHLASHLSCSKGTLQKKAKKLMLDQEDKKLKKSMQTLRKSIAEVMPKMVEMYEMCLKECDVNEKPKKENRIVDSNGASSKNGKKLPFQVPKKHLVWNDTIRKYLCDVVRIKLKCYEISKSRTQSAKEFSKHFLEVDVKNLWPQGWMQTRTLLRESRAVHYYITNRPKKQIFGQKKAHNPLSAVSKPVVSIMSKTITKKSETDKIFYDESVPLKPPVENILEKKENYDLLISNNRVSGEEITTKYVKFFALPNQCSIVNDIKLKNQKSVCVQSNSDKINADDQQISPTVINSKKEITSYTAAVKSNAYSGLVQQLNKQSSFPSKVADYAVFPEGSVASDMLERKIYASLADYPYSGSHNIEKTSKIPVNFSGHNLEACALNLKITNDLHPSPKKNENGELSIENRKACHDIGSHISNIGSNVESLLKSQNMDRQSDQGNNKVKRLPTENLCAVNLMLNNTTVPHSGQFAESFERNEALINKIRSMKVLYNMPAQNPFVVSSSSSHFLNDAKNISDYPFSTTPTSSLENAHKLALKLTNKYSSTSLGSATPPYKKRTTYKSNNKTNDHWTQLFYDSVGSSLLKGMKSSPFPVGIPIRSTLLPAHASPPCSPHNSQKTSHISPGLKLPHESKHKSQTHPNVKSETDV